MYFLLQCRFYSFWRIVIDLVNVIQDPFILVRFFTTITFLKQKNRIREVIIAIKL